MKPPDVLLFISLAHDVSHNIVAFISNFSLPASVA
jgi:hypothetical protein